MLIEELLQEVRKDLKALNEKLDVALKETTRNTSDIEWLKKGAFGTLFTYLGALAYLKFGK